MPFWNPLIGGRKVLKLDLEIDNPAAAPEIAGVTWIDGGPFDGNPTYTLRDFVDDNTGSADQTSGYSSIEITIPSNLIVGGSTNTKSLEIGDFPNQDVKIINNGYIVGNGNSGNAVRVPNNIGSLEIENNGILSSGGTVGSGLSAGPSPYFEFFGGKGPNQCEPYAGPVSTGSPGPGAGYGNGGPISPPASTPFASFPLGPVTFNVGTGSPGPVVGPDAFCQGLSPPYSGGAGQGNKLGNGGSYIIGSGTPLVTFSGSGNIYGPNTNPEGVDHPNGPQPAQP
jgi:hypothetical protein